ncbi:hypothetical protein SPI_05559 [Niveomyces insectorum RCEF 264]|uniref:Lpxtg-domain-containing protein n=1 Tax=Niveomyces insectorum RCEF 264 TaxID=1081102 RepID=A0A167TBV7_9HYPO|nr:hypothetical protein SPI_05559 [Niveomyces insectorum RCEF 264]
MWPPKLAIPAAAVLAGAASALLVAPNSPCAQYCGNVLSSTTSADMTCNDADYAGSAAGTVFETCINCELTSNYASGNETDLQWLIYNVRYAVSYCLFGVPNNPHVLDTPCLTSTACLDLEPAFDFHNLSTHVGAYDFCQAWIGVQVPKCTACLLPGAFNFITNFITILDAACAQMPAPGATLSLQGSTPFSTVPLNVTTPSPTPLYTYTPDHAAIPLGGKVGIAIAGVVLLLSLAGCTIVCVGRRRRRAYLRRLATRGGGGGTGKGYGHSHPGWPSPPVGVNTHDLFDTPMSQRPLRGWDDPSPVSAGTGTDRGESSTSAGAGAFPRYFSPYSSQYNSPVSGDDAHLPSLRSKPSNGSLATTASDAYAPTAAAAAAASSSSSQSKRRQPAGEAYELRAIDGDGYAVARTAVRSTPVLQHPGYGRGQSAGGQSAGGHPGPAHQPRPTPFGGLTEDDAKHGHAV